MANVKTILVVDDEPQIARIARDYLERAGFAVLGAGDGAGALALAASRRPDLVILDLGLPDQDGLDVARSLRKDSDVPIIVLTARAEEADRIIGLELGADDYVTKPFSPRVLLARVRAVLRRKARGLPTDATTIHIRELVINPGRHEVLVHGDPVQLTYTEFRLLHYLARRPGWVFTRQQIIDAVRGDNYPVTDRSVDVQVAGLRRKLGSCGEYVETVRGVGYRFKE
jgi:two-component system phosphate regulon response regulator PhoB